MPRLILTQNILDLSDRYEIRDDKQQLCYLVKGGMVTSGWTVTVTDLQGNALFDVTRGISFIRKIHEVIDGNRILATVTKRLLSFSSFDIALEDGTALEIQGNIFAHECKMLRAGKHIATISKEWFNLPDTYGIEFHDPADAKLVIGCAIAIDMTLFNRY